MELESIQELFKRRKKLVKLLNSPMPPLTGDPELAAFDAEIRKMGTESIRSHIEEIDAQIRERTGGTVDPQAE